MCNPKYIPALLLLCCAFMKGYTQDTTSLSSKAIAFPDKLFSAIDKKARDIEGKLDQQTEKYLARLQKQEDKLKKKIYRKDSTLAKELFGGVEQQYASLNGMEQKLNKHASLYSGHLDSLSTTLSFLKSSGHSGLKDNPQLEKTLQSLQGLQGRMNQADQIKKYLQKRQQMLKEQFQRLGMVKELKKYQKQVYYYQAQVKEYKQIFEDPNKMEARLMEVVMKMPQFKDFFSRNSQLGSLFTLPGSNGSTATSLQGLQTRAMLNEQLAQRFGNGANTAQMLQQNVQQAQGQLNELKNKARQYSSGSFGNGSSDMEMPDYKANTQKTKSFFKRLEYGGNIQSQKARGYFPATADVAATLGFKMNDNSIIGLSVAYKLGLSTGWNDMKLSHQGVGLRSFIDYKLKGSFYISAGYEQNYRSAIKSVEQLRVYNAWQSSGLLGLTKRFKVARKVKGTMQLLGDFLSYRQIPKGEALVFRVGYSF